jgi:hypothetical protein
VGTATKSLSQAEEKTLQLCGERAEVADGYSILEP